MGHWKFGLLLLVCVASAHGTDSVELPPGKLVSGVVEDDGTALILITGDRFDPDDGSSLLLFSQNRTETFDLPGFLATSLIPLGGDRVLLNGRIGPPDIKGSLDVAMAVVEPGRNGELRRPWGWQSRDFWVTHGMHWEYFHDMAPDAQLWGAVGAGSAASFDRAQAPNAKELRVESVVLGSERSDTAEWLVPPDLIILHSDGPVVLTPWNCRGAYIVHFSESGGIARIVPVLLDNGVVEYEFRWQSTEKVLWARTPLYWKAYHLPDLGLSGEPVEPFWVLERSVFPQSGRGIVRHVRENGSYRIEHAYRDPESSIEERHVSDWYGPPQVDGASVPFESLPRLVVPAHPWARRGEARAFVSSNGRHAVVVEKRGSTERAKTYARRVPLRASAPRPSLEADTQAERAAEGPNYYLDLLDPIAFRADRPLRFVFGSVAEAVRRQGSEEGPP